MSEITPEAQPSKETPKPGSLAAIKDRISKAQGINVVKLAEDGISEADRKRATDLFDMQSWQVGMIDSLANAKAHKEVDTTGSFDPNKVAQEMTALEGVQLLDEWIETVLDNSDRKRTEGDMPDDVVRKYAEDLKRKLIDEASQTT